MQSPPLPDSPPADASTAPRAIADTYRTRFAPSPTGRLHFGSLVAAVGSYLCARQARGKWLVRIEDLDPPREVPGSATHILATLETLGFEWDEPVLRQSTRLGAYADAAARLVRSGQAYECSCTRAEIAAASPGQRTDSDELRYAGRCRAAVLMPARQRALRLRVAHPLVTFTDQIQGLLRTDLEAEIGDFVIRRRDGLYAYQLAVSVDDADQNISHVVRGADLLNSTARQIALQRALGFRTPVYAHLPVAVDMDGVKLSKSAGAAAIDSQQPVIQLWHALQFLRQNPPLELRRAGLQVLWNWAIEHWQIAALQGIRTAAWPARAALPG